jgi:tetratricopeptide (TPR) repeat protein
VNPTLPDFYDEASLVDRLDAGLKASGRPVLFVVGSGLTAPLSAGEPGVPTVDGVIDLIRAQFSDQQRDALEATLASATNPYQHAFHFLLGRMGPRAANGIIKQAVACARVPSPDLRQGRYVLGIDTSDETCREFDNDPSGWTLTPGVEALGKLAALKADIFGKMVITTNFDPLIEASISRFGGHSFRTFWHRDGNINQAAGDGTHVVHLHGYWYGSDTLHTPRQIKQERPQLRASLRQVLRDYTVVVTGYGGWDDTFMQALTDVVTDDSAFPEIIWTFLNKIPDHVLQTLLPGLDRGRVTLYSGVNSHSFLPLVAERWQVEPREEPGTPFLTPDPIKPLPYRDSCASGTPSRRGLPESDSPPRVDFLVGREKDIAEIAETPFRVGFITGIGGQGKSVLAANHYLSEGVDAEFDHKLWRDCREQSGRFEDHLVSIVESLNDGRVSGAEISKQSIESIAELFCALTRDLSLLVVFDNVDYYVDLEKQRLGGVVGAFVDRFLELSSNAKLILTCRPPIYHASGDTYGKRLEGIDLQATKELFTLRRAPSAEDEIARAHDVTQGHAFWLDLMAAQVAKRHPQLKLDDLITSIGTDVAEIPDATLRSIWNSLRDREQVVLQSLAETIRPPTVLQLADYLRRHTNFQQVRKATRFLRDLNLIVLKVSDDGQEAFELHPVIRAFILKTMPRSIRKPFIDAILEAWLPFFKVHLPELEKRPTPEAIERWIEGAELYISSGQPAQALERLNDVRSAVRRSQPPGEFVRVTKALLDANNVDELKELNHFEGVFEDFQRILAQLGRVEEAGDALARYRETIVSKDVRYIHYCDMQCYLHWISGNHTAAIRWGQEGVELKSSSGVDTDYSSAHNLALAQRDSGAIDTALKFFLEGVPLKEVTNPSTFDGDRGGPFYGNIGRCLHLMGQIDPALICYRKSARSIENDDDSDHLENQSYIRQWIGELFLAKGEAKVARSFLTAAFAKWSIISPPKATKVQRLAEEAFGEMLPAEPSDTASAEQFVLSWIRSK